MKPIKIRYSITIIIVSLVILYLYFSGNSLFNQIKDKGQVEDREQKEDFSVVTKDEDTNLSQNPNYINAVSAFDRKDYDVAIDELNEEIKKYPNHAQAYFLLGKIYEDVEVKGEKYYLRMSNNYKKYIELKPDGKREDYVKLKLSQYYIKVGLTQQNANLLDKAEEYLKSLNQDNSDVKMALGAIYLDKQNYDQAIAAFEKSTNLSPSELKLKYNSLGLAYIKKKAYAKAKKILEIAIKIDPKDKYAHNNLGFVYVQQWKLKEAKEQFTEAVKLDPSYKNAVENLQWVENELNKKRVNPKNAFQKGVPVKSNLSRHFMFNHY
jgi:tetratricopeptide (TPR) repeat protein